MRPADAHRLAGALGLSLAAACGPSTQPPRSPAPPTPSARAPASAAPTSAGSSRPPSTAGAEAPRADLVIVVRGVRREAGHIRCGLYASADGFPRDREKVAGHAQAPAKDGARCVFHDLKPGHYAVAILHDANDDEKMAYSLLGVPREGFAFSRNAKPSMLGPPAFDAAAVDVRGTDTTDEVTLIHF